MGTRRVAVTPAVGLEQSRALRVGVLATVALSTVLATAALIAGVRDLTSLARANASLNPIERVYGNWAGRPTRFAIRARPRIWFASFRHARLTRSSSGDGGSPSGRCGGHRPSSATSSATTCSHVGRSHARPRPIGSSASAVTLRPSPEPGRLPVRATASSCWSASDTRDRRSGGVQRADPSPGRRASLGAESAPGTRPAGRCGHRVHARSRLGDRRGDGGDRARAALRRPCGGAGVRWGDRGDRCDRPSS